MNTELFIRSKQNPILKPNPNHDWESLKVYNPGAIYEDDTYYLFYRALGSGEDWHSSIGLATSDDGENFNRSNKPLIIPQNEKEKRGVEDPRITKVNGQYSITYTAYGGDTARLFLATSKNLETWEKHGEAIPDWDMDKADGFLVEWDPAQVKAQKNPATRKKWCKAGGIFPDVINNSYWMVFGDRNIWLAKSSDGIQWTPLWEPLIRPRHGDYFDSSHVEMGPPPIKTEKGWLVFYHGVDKNIVYRIGFLLLDLENPTKILFRSQESLFEPKEPYELSGIVDILPGGFDDMEKMDKTELENFIKKSESEKIMPKVAFCCGAVVVNGILRIYYGAGDTFICTATAPLESVLKRIK